MILRYFKSNRTVLLLFIPVLIILFWAESLFHFTKPILFPIKSSVLLFIDLNNWISRFQVIWLVFAITLVILLFQSFWVLKISSDFSFIDKRTFLPAFIFIIFSSLYFPLHQINGVIIGNFFFIMGVNFLFSSLGKYYAYEGFFESTFLISLASLFSSAFLIFWILPIIAFFYMRQFKWQEFAALCLGFLAPIWLYLGLFYVMGGNLITLFRTFFQSLFIYARLPKFVLSDKILLGFLLFISLLAIYYMLKIYKTKKIITRQYYLILLWILALCCAEVFLFPSVSVEIIFVSAFPISILLSNCFLTMSYKWFSELLFTILIVLIVWSQVFPNLDLRSIFELF